MSVIDWQAKLSQTAFMLTESTLKQTSRPPLRAVREARGLSLTQAAQRAGIDPGHLSKVERGEKQLSLEALYRLAVVLDLREFAQMLALYVPADRA